MSSRVYSRQWRDKVRARAQVSALVLAELIVETFAPASVVDVGCGEGWLGSALVELGVERTLGVDGPWVRADVTVDLATPPYPELGRFDVATCFEVAEHVPAARVDELVAWLVALAPVVVFSAAIPGQGGEGHVNEQWPSYWAERFADHGYAMSGYLRDRLWEDDDVAPWYRQNLMVAAAPPLAHELILGADCPPRSLVHPGVWLWHRG